jgi:hypothetical protein
MEVRRLVLRGVEVHDACDAIDVDAACGNVGCDEHIDAAASEGRQGPIALVLGSSTVDGVVSHAVAPELPGEAVGAASRSAEAASTSVLQEDREPRTHREPALHARQLLPRVAAGIATYPWSLTQLPELLD